MFSRLDKESERVIEHALRQAKLLGCAEIETEHFMLGLIDYDKEAEDPVLSKFGIVAEKLREIVAPQPSNKLEAYRSAPYFELSAKRVLAFAKYEAGNDDTTPVHLFLGILRDSQQIAAKAGLTLDNAREVVATMHKELQFQLALERSRDAPMTAEELLSD